ncbi:MAG: hypothetical protein JOZ62_06420, partial [Acidobacteriaceae bacterium]|nr:hypothetical protein [Acidobacteriaceae bacterium]
TDCTVLHGHGLSVGSEVAGGVENVRAERIHFKGTGAGVRIKSNRDRGNEIGNFVYRDLVMEDVVTPILVSEFYPKIPTVIDPAPLTRLTPRFHDITIDNLQATGAHQAAVVVGLPESPIRNLRLTKVHVRAKEGAKLDYVELITKDFEVVTRFNSERAYLLNRVTDMPSVRLRIHRASQYECRALALPGRVA